MHGLYVIDADHACLRRSSGDPRFVPHSKRCSLGIISKPWLRKPSDHLVDLGKPRLVLFGWGDLDVFPLRCPLEFAHAEECSHVLPRLHHPLISLSSIAIPRDSRKSLRQINVPYRPTVLSDDVHQIVLDRMEPSDVPSPGLLLRKAALLDDTILPTAMWFDEDHGRAMVGFLKSDSVRIFRHTSTAVLRVRRGWSRPRRTPSWIRSASR